MRTGITEGKTEGTPGERNHGKMKEIKAILQEIKDTIDYEKERGLLTNGVMDSVELVELVTKLEEEYGIEIPLEEISPENFDSADAILRMTERLRKQKAEQ